MSGASVSRHHADWLSLVEVSGPFVSLPVLMRIFPQGLEPRDPAQAKALRAAYEEWQDNPAIPGNQRAWVMHVLSEVLGYAREQIAEGQALPAGLEAKMPEMGETLRPEFALVGPAGSDTAGQAQLLMASYPAEQDLDKPAIGKHWKATPATRMMELLHGTGVPLGLVTNGEQWTLVYAPRGETTGYAAWYGSLWLDEPITLRAFHSLLGVRRFFGVAADSTLLAMLKESASDQQEVTDQLGYQVREAVEVLVKSVDTVGRENHRALLKDLPETVLYDAALTIMMRLVFLFAAEERGLLHLGKPLYDDNYAVSTLQEQLQETADQHGEEVLERRFDAWTRLLATFRAVHGGIQHQDLLMLAYGGSLFDPDRYPFLEGRAPQSSWKASAAEPLAVNNRVVLHLLNSLQRLQVRVLGGGPAESRRISFRALGVEQIGHVYEGLLDRTAVRASEPVLGIKAARHKERDVSLATLESLFIQGRDKLLEFLKEETGRSLSGLEHALDEVSLLDEHRLLMVCGHDKSVLERIRPFFNLIREDSFGRPLVTLTDSIYVTTATTRRSTGTHYTPPSLTEPIVQHTLEPLVYEGPVEGWPREHWILRSPKAILDLKVCDMAMGSGAFLVQACRYLSERLVESWETLERHHPGEVLTTPEGTFSIGSPRERLVPADTNERITIARRVITDRCLYGVDINPMAVEMAKLSLWLTTLQRDLPFCFLDHALKCGDSLVGVSIIQQIENFSLRPGARQVTFATASMGRSVEDASAKRRTLEELPSNDPYQIEAKKRLYAEAEIATTKIKVLADCLVVLELRAFAGVTYEKEHTVAAERAEVEMQKSLAEFQAFGREQLGGRQTFHWPLEFPEVFAQSGFDAFIGNPPFRGGKLITGVYGKDYREYLVKFLANNIKGHADLCAYFLLRMAGLLRAKGAMGLLATNSISEGDTRQVGLDQLAKFGIELTRAVKSEKWPGTANLEVAHLWCFRGSWKAQRILNDVSVAGISTFLTENGKVAGLPFRLQNSTGRAFQGTVVLGHGFVLSEDEARHLLVNSRNADVIRPYLTGDDLNSRSDQSASRWVINFRDWPLEEAQKYKECMSIVEVQVKPDRLALGKKNDTSAKGYAKFWWQFGRRSDELYSTIKGHSKVLAACRVTKYVTHSVVNAEQIFDVGLNVIPVDPGISIGCLHSSLYEAWVRQYGSSLETRVRYTVTDCFETYPFAQDSSIINDLGDALLKHREKIMTDDAIGLTATYNRFHSSIETSVDIKRMREAQADLDIAIVKAYGWEDLNLGHGFRQTKLGNLYTISEAARREVLDRLLALNHRRHAEEVAENSAQAASAPVKRGRKKKRTSDESTLDLL